MYKHLHKMAKNTRKKMKKIYSKKMKKSNKKNNNKYTRRPHQTRKKVFRGGGLGFPISLDELNTGKYKYKLVKDFQGSCQDIFGWNKLITQIIKEKKTSITQHSDGLDYYIKYDNTGRIADIFSQNPHTRITTQVAIVPIVPKKCSPANNIINGGADGDKDTLQKQQRNQSGGVIGNIRLNKLLNRPNIPMGVNSGKESPPPQPNVNENLDPNVKELIRRLQPEFIRGSTQNPLVGAIRKNDPSPAAAAAADSPDDVAPAAAAAAPADDVDNDALLLEKLKNVTSVSDLSPANVAILTSLSDTFDVNYDDNHNKEHDDVDPADDAAADADAADAAIPADVAPIEWKPLQQAAVSIDAMTLPASINKSQDDDDLDMGLTNPPVLQSQLSEPLTIEKLDELNARLRNKLPPTIDPTFLFDEIDKFQASLLADEKFAESVWLARIIKDNTGSIGSSSKNIEDLFVFRLSSFPSGEETIFDEETKQHFVYPAALLVRCRLDRVIRGVYVVDKNSKIESNIISISETTAIKDGWDIYTLRLVNIYKLEDGKKWRSRNDNHIKAQQFASQHDKIPFTDQPQAQPSPLKIEAKKTFIQFIVYRDNWHVRPLPNQFLGFFRSEKYQVDGYYVKRFGLVVIERPIMYGLRALNAIALTNHRGYHTSGSVLKEVKDLLWGWLHRKELKKRQIPSGPVWGDLKQWNTYPLRVAGAGYSGGSKTAKMRKSRSNKRTIKRSRS